MFNLIKVEFYKFWKRKINWILLVSIPFLIFISAYNFNKSNLQHDITNASYVNSLNFPYQLIQEQFLLGINILIIYYVAIFIVDEFKCGEARLILTRGVKKITILSSKLIVIGSSLLLFYVLLFIFSTIFGRIFLPEGECIYKFFTIEKLVGLNAWMYIIKYFILSYFTCIVIMCIFALLGLLSKNANVFFGVAIGFVLFSVIYPEILAIFIEPKFGMLIRLTSIVSIQFKGIALYLADPKMNMGMWSCLVYMISSLALLKIISNKKDYLH